MSEDVFAVRVTISMELNDKPVGQVRQFVVDMPLDVDPRTNAYRVERQFLGTLREVSLDVARELAL